MVQRRDCARFPLEALLRFWAGREMLGEHFDRDDALQSCVAGAIDFSHPSRAQRRLNLVRSEFRTRREGHNARIIAPLRAHFLRGWNSFWPFPASSAAVCYLHEGSSV